jgi:hypothetical protein
MWPILANLFIYNANIILNPRNNNLNPTTNQIFEICEKANITFADIVTGTNPAIPVHQVGRSILVDNQYTWNKYSDSQLEYLASQGWLDDNVEQIVNYINNTPTIKHVYFTFKSGRWLSSKMELIKQGITVQTKCSIISPSGNGFGKLLPGYPTKVESLAHCWVWNGLPNIDFINKIGYCPLNHHWLISKGVNPNNF